jgi:hypothetical protein
MKTQLHIKPNQTLRQDADWKKGQRELEKLVYKRNVPIELGRLTVRIGERREARRAKDEETHRLLAGFLMR